MTRSVVVFPHPDGPSSVKNSPSATCTDTPSSAWTPLNRLTTSVRRTSIFRSPPDSRLRAVQPFQLGVPLEHKLPERVVHQAVASLGGVVIVDIANRFVEEGAHARELGHARQWRTRRAFHLV